MASNSASELAAVISRAITCWQDAMALFDAEARARLQLSSSERKCLSCITHGARPARYIAEITGLTRGSVTSLVDRLEARGLVRRESDNKDGRQVLVVLTAEADELMKQCYEPVAVDGADLLASFTPDQLKTILKFTKGSLRLQLHHVDRLREAVWNDAWPSGRG